MPQRRPPRGRGTEGQGARDERERPRRPPRGRGTDALEAFEQLWAALFTTPIHLDSALAKLPRELRARLAEIVPEILRRPISLAEALGVRIPAGEPWSSSDLAAWRPARAMASGLLSRGERPWGAGEIGAARAMASTPLTRGERPWGAGEIGAARARDFPPRITREIEALEGADPARIFAVLGERPPLSLRASRRFGAERLLALVEERWPEAPAARSRLSPLGVVLESYAPVARLDAAFEIQDEGSQLMAMFALWPERVVPILSDRPGETAGAVETPKLPQPVPWTVIDACAGGGGKSLALGDLLLGKGRVFSYDVSAQKLDRLRRRAKRAGLTNLKTSPVEEGKETELADRFERSADVVLVDAPCSGWGSLRRSPDIKWRLDPIALERLPALQLRLLSVYSRLTAPGGRLVYGACTFRPSETTAVARAFLEQNPGFEPGPGGFLGPGPSDGFFMRAFTRRRG